METRYQICTRCIMDTTDPDIEFDEDGICNHCKRAAQMLASEPYYLSSAEKEKALQVLVEHIQAQGIGKPYDCVIGLSGGVDSTYTAYIVKQLGLRPLAVHLDNGWDAELAVKNIENICAKLDIDLYTHVIDWDEFKDLQVAFLKASTPDSEIPTDHGIVAILYTMAARHNVRFILSGMNTSTESIMPVAWSQGHSDWKYIKSIHSRFGTKPLATFPHLNKYVGFYYRSIRKIYWIRFLNYVDYHKEDAKKVIQDTLGWRDYGRKHYESLYTKFYQAYILPTKFGFDKRRGHLSSLICSGQLTREEALKHMEEALYPEKELQDDMNYVIKKFGMSRDEFDSIMALPPKSYWDYPSYDRSQFLPYYRLLTFLKKVWLTVRPHQRPDEF